MCKAKSCQYYKTCAVKRDLVGESRCADYKAKTEKKK